MTDDASNWRNWPLAERERQYSPSSCVATIAPYLDAYAARSRDAERHFRCQKNLVWGERPGETFDYFPAASADAPLLVYIHGGYWQELSKNESLFAAPDCVANGIAFAAIDYTLAPQASVGFIVDQCRRAIALAAPAGWSAGIRCAPHLCRGQFRGRASRRDAFGRGLAGCAWTSKRCCGGRHAAQRNLRSRTADGHIY